MTYTKTQTCSYHAFKLMDLRLKDKSIQGHVIQPYLGV